MTSLDGELSRDMDRITQLQDGIDGLVTIMYSTLSYLQRRANFRQLKADIPVTQTIPDVEDPAVFKANCQELVDDFVKKAKQIEHLITILPDAPPAPRTDSSDDARPSGGSQEDEKEFEELEADLQLANKEYLEAVRTAEALHEQVRSALRTVLDERQQALASIPS